ncbi:MAG TPA: DHH family phosphoesterase [Candidatus Saccharimonadales bacterium]|nr:DHH family phosphoesterase [Candidatus Saccharimonadales bacterium]
MKRRPPAPDGLAFDAARWAPIAALLKEARQAVVATHIHPDGDAIGSQVAMVRLLRRLGATACGVLPDEVPYNLRFLDPAGVIRCTTEGRAESALRGADLVVVLDVSKADRLGRLCDPVLASTARRVCIDHHADGDFPAHAAVLDTAASSTGELICELAHVVLGPEPLPRELALPLYVAVLTDTGGFRFSNTGPRTHRLAAELLATGIEPPQVHHEVYEKNKPEVLRLLGMALAGLQTDVDGRLAWVNVTQEQLRAASARPEDVDGFVDLPRTLDGVQIVILFMELASGRLKVSLRSRDGVNVQRLASGFGGGGHIHAAGILMDGPWDRARESVLEAARQLLRAAAPEPGA